MMGMGMVNPPEVQAAIDDAVTARKAKVAASLGKTLEEFDADVHAQMHHHHDEHDHDHEHDDDAASGKPEVDEQMVLDYLRSRQQIIDDLRSQVRSLQATVTHLEHERDLANTKCAALRDALAKMREAAKTQN